MFLRLIPLFATAFIATASAFAADEIIATVNGKPIYKNALDVHLSQLPPMLLQGREEEVKKQLMERIIDQEIVVQQAAIEALNEDPVFRAQFDIMRRNAIYNGVVRKVVERGMTEQALRAYYEEQKNNLAAPAVRAKHILVADKAEAEKIIRELAKGKSFDELAKEKSLDTGSKETGGELGWFRKGDMVEPFANAAFAMSIGEVSKQPVQSQFGFHVIRVEEKNDKFIPPLEAIAPQIQQAFSQKLTDEYLNKLKSEAQVEIR